MKMLSVRPCPSCGAFKQVKLCRIHFAVKRYDITHWMEIPEPPKEG